jgi:capsular polysaccharide biosynthesis protein
VITLNAYSPVLYCREVEDAVFCPRGTVSSYEVVYDANDDLVVESAVRRGTPGRLKDVTEAPARLPDSLRVRAHTRDHDLLFLGYFDHPHFGHWLTEGLARFWYLLDQDAAIPIAKSTVGAMTLIGYVRRLRSHYRNRRMHWHVALRAFDLTAKRFRSIAAPVRVKRMLVPSPSLSYLSYIHPRHLEVTRRVGRHVLQGDLPTRDAAPVYYSRTQLRQSTHTYFGEEPIEDYCRRQGARIVYPEQLTLREQITIVEQHDVFIGLVGSAFHSLLFRNNPHPVKCYYLGLGEGARGYGAYEQIDDVMGSTAFRIACCKKIPRTAEFSFSQECDAEKTIAALESAGALGGSA